MWSNLLRYLEAGISFVADWGYFPACVLWFAVDYNNNLVYRELYTKKVTADILHQS